MEQKQRLFSNRMLLALIVPLVIENALSLIVGMVDSIMVSSAGEAAVSGVSLIDTVMVLVIYIFSAMAAGGAVVAGQYLGSGDQKAANQAANEMIWLNGVISVFITANTITQTLASVEVIPGMAIQMAIVTVVARCVGAQDYEQAKYYNRRLLLVTALAHAVWGGLMYAGLPLILGLYSNLTAETVSLVRSMFLWHTIGAAVLWPLAFIQTASLRAAGDVKYPMIMSILSMWVMRIGGAYLLVYPLGVGVAGVWVSMAVIDWGFRAVIYALRWRSGKWKTMKVI